MVVVFSERLKDLLRRKDILQKELAEKVGVSEAAVTKWLSGGSITGDNLASICKALGVSADYLLGLSESDKKLTERERIITDYTGLSDSSIKMLHQALVRNNEQANRRRRAANLLVQSPPFISFLDAIFNYCTLSVECSDDYSSFVLATQNDLLDLAKSDKATFSELATEFYGEENFWMSTEEHEAHKEEQKKKLLQEKKKERNVSLFLVTDLASEMAKSISKAEFDANLQSLASAYLLSIHDWLEDCFASGHASELSTAQSFESESLSYDEYVSIYFPSHERIDIFLNEQQAAARKLKKQQKKRA